MVAPVLVEGVDFRYDHGAGATASLYGPEPEPGDTDAAPLVLQGVGFHVPAGTLTVLCGASGSGKSTALRLLNGLVPNFHGGAVSGTVRVGGVDVPDLDLAESGRSTATVFQNPRTQFFTTEVRSELAFRSENYGLDPALIEQRSAAAAAEVGISCLLDRGLRRLSGGELQKVACAQAIAADTEVLLFDEPTSNLSPDAIEEFGGLLRRLKAAGRALVVAEHRLYFLRGIADQVIQLDHGRIAHRWTGPQFAALSEADAASYGLRSLHPPRSLPVLLSSAAGRPSAEGIPASADRGEHDARGLVLAGVRFSYGRRRVLDLDALGFPAGQVTALIGANGAGKSTLARLICGLERPRRGGTIRLSGKVLSAGERLRCSAMVMQDVHRQLFSDTVRDEIVLGLDREARARVDVDGVLARLDLSEVADRHPLSLSGGQKQRVVIAAAVARQARVCVFDEPTSGVDRRHLRAIAADLRALASAGAVVIVITHDPELVDACAQRIVALHPLNEASGQRVDVWDWQPGTDPVSAADGEQTHEGGSA